MSGKPLLIRLKTVIYRKLEKSKEWGGLSAPTPLLQGKGTQPGEFRAIFLRVSQDTQDGQGQGGGL